MSTSTEEQIKELQQIVQEAEARLNQAKSMLNQVAGTNYNQYASPQNHGYNQAAMNQPYSSQATGRVIMGNFSGEYMVGDDKKQYPVPANYASKSKLVEGDQLKLTITEDGAFIYKQVGPIPRRRSIGTIIFKDNAYYCQVGTELYRILTASITYFRLSPGDEVTILTPLTQKSEWAAIENVVSSQGGMQMASPDQAMTAPIANNPMPSAQQPFSQQQPEQNPVPSGEEHEEESQVSGQEEELEQDSEDVKIQPW